MTSVFTFGSRSVQATLIGLLASMSLVPVAAAADELSDKSAQVVMEYAWGLVPQQFTMPNGKTVLIDKTKKSEIVVPLDVARDVIRVGYRSAHAKACDLKEEQIRNYNSLMRREIEKKKWTDQQLIYISQLHLTTMMLLTGRIQLIDREGGKEVKPEVDSPSKLQCTPELSTKVKSEIEAYVASGPALAPAETAATTAPGQAPAASAQPAPVATKPASQKK